MNNPNKTALFGACDLPASLRANGCSNTLRSMNLDILIALAPAAFWGIYIYGMRAALLMILSVASAIAIEILLSLIFRRPVLSFCDLSSSVSAIIAALLLPPSASILTVILASLITTLICKLSGALSRLPINPAAVSVSFLLLFFGEKMYSYPIAGHLPISGKFSARGVYTITPLIAGTTPNTQWYELFFGSVCGPVGCLSILLIISGGIYLLIRRISSPKAVLAFLAGAAVCAYLVAESANAFENVLYVMLTGQFAFAAFFLVSLPASRPTDSRLEMILPLLCGAFSVWYAFEGNLLSVPIAVLAMNAIACLSRLLPPSQKAFGLAK